MQTQIQEKNVGELLGQIRGKTVSRTIKEITPLGVRLVLNSEGQFVGGKLNARHLETTTVFLKLDGTSEWETKAIETTMEGDLVVASGRGTGRAAGPTKIWAEGETFYMTQSPKLSWLNGTKGRVEISADNATGEFEIKAYTPNRPS